MATPHLPGAVERAVEGDVHHSAPGVGRHVLGGTPKLAAALLTSTSGSPKASSAASNAAATRSGVRMSQTAVATSAPSSSIALRPASRCSAERLAITIAAPSRANSEAMALPSPVPPPVTSTVRPSKVPGRSAVSPAGGGAGRPGCKTVSAPGVARVPALGSGRPHLGEVVAAVEERLVDQLVGHGSPLLRPGQLRDDPADQLHRDCRCSRDGLAMARASASRSWGATTRDTMPWANASSALSVRP